MAPSQMEAYLVSFYEYHVLYILSIEHVEPQSTQGAWLINCFFIRAGGLVGPIPARLEGFKTIGKSGV